MDQEMLDVLKNVKGTKLEDWLLLLELANGASSGEEAADIVSTLCDNSWPLLIETSFHEEPELRAALMRLEQKSMRAKGKLNSELKTLEDIIYTT